MGKTSKTIYDIINYKYFKLSDVESPEEFLLKCKQEFNVSYFIPIDVKKSIQQIGLEYGLFSQIIKIRQAIVVKTDTASIKKKKRKEPIFKFEGQSS